jgi:predicted CoA-substrate-specific enzyme activase
MLKIETDYTPQGAAQALTRLQAFFEGMKAHVPPAVAPLHRNGDYFAGIDSGSTTTNAVILGGDRVIVSSCTVPTGVQVAESARRALEEALAGARMELDQVQRTVTTGYGRACVAFRERDVTEITCHAKGARFLNPAVRTVIDVGGQDSKVIRLDERGGVRSFVMNDKCAAGTGRFLEMMAQSLELSIEEIGVRGLVSREEITISSMCSVFAQSEVVSLVAAGKRLEDIVRGLNRSVAAKVTALAGRSGLEREWMMTGGVARNLGVVAAIEERLGGKLILPEAPELCGALGAALIAMEEE